MINLGDRTKELCEERQISINHLPASTVKNIIYGNSKNPGVQTIAKICRALGITLAEFFEE